tara:strand:- start:1565 stop:2137 length:573 start_codon:yes stop_codon:yes gene_type:complete
MRIISGDLKGSKLYLPKNKDTRPLKDLVKESIFNLLIHSKEISLELKESIILDLFSGTGSFGLECLSRKAKRVYFIEEKKEVVEILKKNIEKLKLTKKTKIFHEEVFSLIEKKNIFSLQFELIFCDPPFKNSNLQEIIQLIYERKLLKPNGVIILHRNKNTKEMMPKYFKLIDERNYGISKIIIGKFLPG